MAVFLLQKGNPIQNKLNKNSLITLQLTKNIAVLLVQNFSLLAFTQLITESMNLFRRFTASPGFKTEADVIGMPMAPRFKCLDNFL